MFWRLLSSTPLPTPEQQYRYPFPLTVPNGLDFFAAAKKGCVADTRVADAGLLQQRGTKGSKARQQSLRDRREHRAL